MADSIHDLLIVGGGINGAGIARDAAGRGLSVLLVEQDDLASHTSSASTKLVHGGLRYLEYYEFRLVRESLLERERLLRLAPHIIWPLRFVMPMPPGGRPAWLIRMGLFLYDHIGGRRTLPGSRGVSRGDGVFEGLGNQVTRGFEYSDCWVDDARLVVLNAVGARELGAEILTRTKLTAARREGDLWVATILDRRSGAERTVRARAVVNAAGPWVGKVLEVSGGVGQARAPRLVKGSHIIVPRRLPGDHAFILQNPDKRIVFAIPYEDSFTLIGTTDVSFTGDPSAPEIAPDEVDYLCESANHYLAEPIAPSDVVRSYSGVRPLYDDGREDASKVTRDYVLEVDAEGGAPLLSVFGGKITTYRRLAEHALTKLTPYLKMKPAWTAHAPLPGGDKGFAAFSSSAWNRWSFISRTTLRRQLRSLGNRLAPMLGGATSLADLGEDFGGGLTACEVDYYVREEWARTTEDILWRRTKIGLHTGPETAQKLRAYLGEDR